MAKFYTPPAGGLGSGTQDELNITANEELNIGVNAVPGQINLSAYSGVYISQNGGGGKVATLADVSGGAIISQTKPTPTSEGQQWFNTKDNTMHIALMRPKNLIVDPDFIKNIKYWGRYDQHWSGGSDRYELNDRFVQDYYQLYDHQYNMGDPLPPRAKAMWVGGGSGGQSANDSLSPSGYEIAVDPGEEYTLLWYGDNTSSATVTLYWGAYSGMWFGSSVGTIQKTDPGGNKWSTTFTPAQHKASFKFSLSNNEASYVISKPRLVKTSEIELEELTWIEL